MEKHILNIANTDLPERKELIQDVVDRLLSNPDYKEQLKKLNEANPPKKNYNRYLESYRKGAVVW